MSDLYTCITCRVAFKENESQRLHYKSDWHRYNLKRKVAELVSVSAEEFINRVNAQKNERNVASNDVSKYCDSCRKHFNNDNSYANHLNSKKHKENENQRVEVPCVEEESKSAEEMVAVVTASSGSVSSDECEEIDSDEWEDDCENPVVTRNVCLFCKHRSRTFVRNLRHMSSYHSFFIPDAEFCADVHGLICYLGEKVYEGFMCLWCNDSGRAFHSSEAAQGHMRDKGHCKMLHEGAVLAEYVMFYDYSTSYPPDDDERTPVDVDEEVDVSVLDGSDYQLVLPSGAVIGHRSLFRYYRQPVRPGALMLAPSNTRSGRTLRRVLAEYKSLGWLQTKREQAAKNARDVRYMMRVQNKWATKLELKANKFQTHFRQQVNY